MIQAKIEMVGTEKHLVITIPMQEPTLSETGKTFIVANLNFAKTTAEIDGKPITIKGTAFYKAK